MTATTVYRWLAVAILGGIGVHKYLTVRTPPAVAAYHQRVRESASRVPNRIGAWVGQDVRMPVQAVRVLDPNLVVSRRYVNVENGSSAGLMFVHCRDAHDMAGHFPVRCYQARGWDLRSARERDWALGDLRVTAMEYEFHAPRNIDDAEANSSIIVVNCLFRPDGQIFRDMDAMTRAIIGAGGQSSGAAQVQVYFDRSAPEARRDAAVAELLAGFAPVIDAVLADLPE